MKRLQRLNSDYSDKGTHEIFRNNLRHLFYISVIIFTMMFNKANAQDAEAKKFKAKVQINYFKEDSNQRHIAVKVFRKEGKEFIFLQWKAISLYLNEISESEDNLLGMCITDENGEGNIPLDIKFSRLTDTVNEYNFIGRLAEDKELEEVTSELTIKEAKLSIELSEEDSIRTVKATLAAFNEKKEIAPVAEAEIHFYVKKTFSLLPLSEEAVTTDENGEATLEFPKELRGDTAGNLIVVAQVEDHDDYGTVQAQQIARWGVPSKIHLNGINALWASRTNAPYQLVIASTTIIVAVWGVILYVFFQLYKFRKLNQSNN